MGLGEPGQAQSLRIPQDLALCGPDLSVALGRAKAFSPLPTLLFCMGSRFPHRTQICRRCLGKARGSRGGRERVPSRRLQPVCREHPSICRELRTLPGIRAIGGQHDVRDGAWQELAPPHLSPPIRTTLGQHKFFHVRLQHLFIISTKPQDITASDTLESFQELETEEGFPPAAIPRQRREGFVVRAADGGAGDLAQPRCRCGPSQVSTGRGHGGTRAASPGHCPAKTTASACPSRRQPQFHPHPSIGLVPTSLPCSVSTGSYTNSFSRLPPAFLYKSSGNNLQKVCFCLEPDVSE